jgi:hypothetical protein
MKILLIVLIVLVGSCGKKNGPNNNQTAQGANCPQTPKRCPDGHTVLPTLPGCVYQPCPGQMYNGAFYGYNLSGQVTNCTKNTPQTACPMGVGQGHTFAQSCRQMSGVVFQCDCQNFLCSRNPLNPNGGGTQINGSQAPPGTVANGIGYGYDMNSRLTSCQIQASTTCTMQMSEASYFAQKCRRLNFTAVTCGCHSYLCSGVVPRPFN